MVGRLFSRRRQEFPPADTEAAWKARVGQQGAQGFGAGAFAHAALAGKHHGERIREPAP
jgi:hypothetical protein